MINFPRATLDLTSNPPKKLNQPNNNKTIYYKKTKRKKN